MTPIEVLEGAAELLSRPGAWIQGDWARDSNGETVPADDEEAVCFCLLGALDRIAKRCVDRPAWRTAVDLLHETTAPSLWRWNDEPGRTQAEVVAALRETARRAK